MACRPQLTRPSRAVAAARPCAPYRATQNAAATYSALMSLEWEQVVVDAADPQALGRWWADALRWVIVDGDDVEFEIRPSADQLPCLLFIRVDDGKAGKNRLHLDFRPDDQDAEVTRLLALGARRIDIGQGEQTWVVLADPEGNEFCVLSRRRG